jgi:uncharacterized protein (DUF302 family)
MVSMALAFEVRVDAPFDEAVDRVGDALREQGFGILTRIDVRKTFKEKLDVDFRDYVILGACNPKLAYRALTSRPEVGLMLPCNVTLEEEPDGAVTVRIGDPETMLVSAGFEGDPEVAMIAKEAHGLLGLAAESLAKANSRKP